MGLETGSFIDDLVGTNPTGGDGKNQGDDHLRLIKNILKGSFPDVDQAVSTIISSTTEPPLNRKGTIWLDETLNVIKLRNTADSAWITLAPSMTASNEVDIDGGTVDGVNIGGTTPATNLDVDNINVNGNTISSTDAAGDINITPDTTGDLILDGLKWPQADGTTNQLLKTNGSGQLSWATGASQGIADILEDTTPQLGGNLDCNGFDITLDAGDTVDGRDLSVDGARLDTLADFDSYDMAFNAGWDNDSVKEDIAVAVYSNIVAARAGTFIAASGYMDTAPSGTAATVDVLKNGSTIYSVKPKFDASATLTDGTLSTTTFAAGDRITFKITAVGGGTVGQGMRFTLKNNLS